MIVEQGIGSRRRFPAQAGSTRSAASDWRERSINSFDPYYNRLPPEKQPLSDLFPARHLRMWLLDIIFKELYDNNDESIQAEYPYVFLSDCFHDSSWWEAWNEQSDCVRIEFPWWSVGLFGEEQCVEKTASDSGKSPTFSCDNSRKDVFSLFNREKHRRIHFDMETILFPGAYSRLLLSFLDVYCCIDRLYHKAIRFSIVKCCLFCSIGRLCSRSCHVWLLSLAILQQTVSEKDYGNHPSRSVTGRCSDWPVKRRFCDSVVGSSRHTS